MKKFKTAEELLNEQLQLLAQKSKECRLEDLTDEMEALDPRCEKRNDYIMKLNEKNKDKLIFTPKKFSESRNCRVRLTDEAAYIVNQLWLQTGLSATEIVSSMIEFAAERVEIEKTAFDD